MPSSRTQDEYDVIVVGGGNAALCAAMAARHIVSRVLVLERAPEHMRGGNTRHTRNVRCAHPTSDKYCSGAYPEEEFFDDLVAVTGGPANPDLAKFVIRQSSKLYEWMSEHGASWQPPLAGTLHLGRTNRWFLGGGKALLNAYYRTAQRMGICVRYDSVVEDLIVENGRFEAVALKGDGGRELVRGRTVVVATGGYEANLEWLERNWGEAARNFVVRGTPYNDGLMLAALLARGAKAIGDPKGFHAIALDARAPKYDGGIVTRLDSIPFGIVVNRLAQRFYDEGEEVWPKRYAIWGGLVAAQPEQLAYCIVDAQTIRRFVAPAFKPYEAETIEGLARACSLDPQALTATVAEYNGATSGNGPLRIEVLDGNSTRGILPKKSNWALPLDHPPFYAFPLRPGITFTYMGVTVDETARILEQSGRPMDNIYAAGEIMSGNILTKGYLAGLGLTIGSVLGELAEGARQHVPGLELFAEADRQLTLCNACRYCEGYCAVFQAIELRREFDKGDVFYLSNLCHDCRACYYACMYSPPHEFAINIPKILSEARVASYEHWSWPGLLARAFAGRRVAWMLAGGGAAVVLALSLLLIPAGSLWSEHLGAGAFYGVIPYAAMVAAAVGLSAYWVAVWLFGAVRCWRDTGVARGAGGIKPIARAVGAALGLRYLQGGGPGCSYPEERPSAVRRIFHSLVFWGFACDFVSTTLAYIHQDWLHELPPYSLGSAPVIFGAVGGLGLLVGCAGLIWCKVRSDRAPMGASGYGLDYDFLSILALTALTGLLTLALRSTAALGSLLALHLALVAALFITAPYGKFVHAIYRLLALVKYYAEQDQPRSSA